jgi:predicted nucleic acid-binding protein
VTPVIVDTGPLVAFLNRRDAWHAWAREQFEELDAPFETCEAVVAETAFLLRNHDGGSAALMALLTRRLVVCSFRLETSAQRVADLMGRYWNVPMSVADACLVRMSEEQPAAKLLTLDSDFRVYRKLGRQVIPLISPVRPPARSTT